MDWGSLPEWFTACAEVLAVCTALFLPRYQARRERQESLARMRRVTTRSAIPQNSRTFKVPRI